MSPAIAGARGRWWRLHSRFGNIFISSMGVLTVALWTAIFLTALVKI